MEVFNPNSGKKGLVAGGKSEDPEDMMLKGGFDSFSSDDDKLPTGFSEATDYSTATPIATNAYYEKMPFLKQVICSVVPPAYYKYKGITKEGYVFFVRIVSIILLLILALLAYIKYSEIGGKEGILDSWVPDFTVQDGMLYSLEDGLTEWEGDIFPYYPKAFPHIYANVNIKEFEDIENNTDLNMVLADAKPQANIQNPAYSMLILSRTNYIKVDGKDWKIVSYTDLPSAKYDKAWMLNRYEEKYKIFAIIGVLLCIVVTYLVIFLGYRLVALIYSLICMLLCLIMRKKLTELNRLKCAGYAMVPSFIVSSIYILMPSGIVSAGGFTYAMIGSAILPIVIMLFAIPNME